MKLRSIFLLLCFALTLSGCNLVVLNPSGDVATQQGNLIIYSTVLMLIVIIPVLALTAFFAWKYRAGNKDVAYEPDWDHSVSLEIVIWSVPLAIIICLAGLTWVSTHRLDPYKELDRVSASQPLDPNVKPLEIQVVALDWKWLFIYPELNIATVNEVAAITDRPIEFKLTSATVMNAFYVPDMAGMIYTMAGMETELNGVMNKPGTYEGLSSQYSGQGFSHMNFEMHVSDEAGFDAWVEKVRAEGHELNRDTYVELEEKSVAHPIEYFNNIQTGMWDKILNMCVGDDTLCLNDMMMVDALGGGGLDGLYNRELYRGLCSADDPEALFVMLRPELYARQTEIVAAVNLLPPSSDPIRLNQSNVQAN